MKRILLLALCALFAGTAGARTLYVDAKRPNNKGNGLSSKKAKKTIQAAINIAKKGDTILVYPGTYAPIKTNNKKITVKSVKGVSKTKIVAPTAMGKKLALAQLGKSYKVYLDADIKTTGSSGIWTKGTSTTLEGFLLDGMCQCDNSSELIGVSGGTVKRCTIQRFGHYWDTYATIAVNSRLTDCTVQKNHCGYLAPIERWASGIGNAVGSGNTPNTITGSQFTRCIIRNNICQFGIEGGNLVGCLVYGNTTYYDDMFGTSTLLNCTVVKNTIEAYECDVKFSRESKFYNCILWNNWMMKEEKPYYVYRDADGNYLGSREADSETIPNFRIVDREGNLISDNVTEEILDYYLPGYTREEKTRIVPGTVKKLHNVDSGNTSKNTDKTNKNPKFMSATKDNYKLKKGSYAINKGRLTASQKKALGATDLGGRARIRGKYVDRGCYER